MTIGDELLVEQRQPYASEFTLLQFMKSMDRCSTSPAACDGLKLKMRFPPDRTQPKWGRSSVG